MEIFFLIRVTQKSILKIAFSQYEINFLKCLKMSNKVSIGDFHFFIVSWVYPIVYNGRITF